MNLTQNIRTLLDSGACVFGPGTVVFSGIRLARNLEGLPFPAAASVNLLESVVEQATAAIRSEEAASRSGPMEIVRHAVLTPSERDFLFERELVSKEFLGMKPNRTLAFSTDGTLSVQINAEDHLRIRAIAPGASLERLWTRISDYEAALERRLRFAFRPQWGYLTASPANVGTAMRAWSVLHLPALVMTGQAKGLLENLPALGFQSAPYCAAGGKAAGSLFRISNVSTLGEREEDLLDRLNSISSALSQEEERATLTLATHDPLRLLNACGRAFGILKHAFLISPPEAFDALSLLKLGLNCGAFHTFTAGEWAENLLRMQPAHLNCASGRALNELESAELRAKMFRKWLNGPAVDRG